MRGGKASRSSNATTCADCARGRYQNVDIGQASCLPCIPGKFGNQTGLTSCYECAIGKSVQISNATSCLDCARGRYQNVVGQASCLPCIPGEFQNETGKTECKLCAEGTASGEKNRTIPCDLCASGRTANPGSTACSACPAGKYIGTNNICTTCNQGLFTSSQNQASCQICESGETSIGGICAKCDVGQYDAGHRRCEKAPPGTYQDGKGESTTKPCPKDTWSDVTGATSNAQCIACAADRTTGGRSGSTSNTSCLCRATEFYKDEYSSSCKPCPEGADCSAKHGATLGEIYAKSGFWRAGPRQTAFTHCKKGYAGISDEDATSLSLARCCPTTTCSNISNFTDPDQQCLHGYRGPLCAACAHDHVRVLNDCVLCKVEPLSGAAFLALALTCAVVSLCVAVVLLKCTTRKSAESTSGRIWWARSKS